MRSVLSTFVPFVRIVAAVLLVGVLLAASASGPAVLIGSLPHPDFIAAEGADAYVTSYDPAEGSQVTVFAVPIAGGAARRLATLPGSPLTGIAVRAATVYFTQAGSGKVWSLPLGTLPHPIATGQQEPWAIAVDRTHVYFTRRGTLDHADGEVVRVPIAGGPVQVIASGLRSPQHLALDDANVYVTDLGRRDHDLMDGAVVRIPKRGGPAVVLAAEQRIVTGLAADGKSVYWTSEARRGTDGRVIRFDLAGGRPPVVLASGEGSPGSIALGETAVFWTCYEGLVRKIAKQGGKPATIGSGQARPNAIAVGPSAVVWANLGKVVGERELPGALMVLRR